MIDECIDKRFLEEQIKSNWEFWLNLYGGDAKETILKLIENQPIFTNHLNAIKNSRGELTIVGTAFVTDENKHGSTLIFETDSKEKFAYMQEKARECIDNRMQMTTEEQRIALLQYKELREWLSIFQDIMLGKDYYNLGCDVYTCDRLTLEDLICKYGSKKQKQDWDKAVNENFERITNNG